MVYILLLLSQLVFLFFLSRIVTKKLFFFLRRIIHKESLVFSLVSLIYLPGTIIHEFGHFIMAMVLFLRVTSISIFPEWKGNYIKLGSVVYEKRDYLRSIIVGIAPLFSGLFFFFFIAYFNFWPANNFLVNAFLLYLMFTVSSTMFSSKQDLKDLIFIIPFAVVFGGIIYVFNINLSLLFNDTFINVLIHFARELNFYLLISVIINLSLIVLLNFFKFIFR